MLTCQADAKRRGPGGKSPNTSSTMSAQWLIRLDSMDRYGDMASPQQRATRAQHTIPEKASHPLWQRLQYSSGLRAGLFLAPSVLILVFQGQ